MIVAADWLASVRCCECGADGLFSLECGNEEARGPGDILIEKGRSVRAWCRACAMQRFALLEAAA